MAMPFAPVNRMKNTHAPIEKPCVRPQSGTSITAAKKVNRNTRLAPQLTGGRGWTDVLCDMLRLEWNGCVRNVTRPPRRCGTCVGNARHKWTLGQVEST